MKKESNLFSKNKQDTDNLIFSVEPEAQDNDKSLSDNLDFDLSLLDFKQNPFLNEEKAKESKIISGNRLSLQNNHNLANKINTQRPDFYYQNASNFYTGNQHQTPSQPQSSNIYGYYPMSNINPYMFNTQNYISPQQQFPSNFPQQIQNQQPNFILPVITLTSLCEPTPYNQKINVINKGINTPSMHSSLSNSNNSSNRNSPRPQNNFNPQKILQNNQNLLNIPRTGTNNSQQNKNTAQYLSIQNKKTTSSPSINHLKEKDKNSEKPNLSKPPQQSIISSNQYSSRSDQVSEISKGSANISSDFDYFLNKCNITYINSQKGSKKIQKAMDNIVKKEEIDILYDHSINELVYFVNHKYGNYYSQKLLQKLDFAKRTKVWEILTEKNILLYALNEFGNHSIQILISSTESETEEDTIMAYFKNYYSSLSYNKYGSFILQRILKTFSQKWKSEILSFIGENFNSLLFHVNGVCLIKKFISYGDFDSNEKKNAFMSNFKYLLYPLITDKYANYFCLFILEEWGLSTCKDIVVLLKNNIIDFMENKNSIDVILKYLSLNDNIQEKNELSYYVFDCIIKSTKIIGENPIKILKELRKYLVDEDLIKRLDTMDDLCKQINS